MWSEPPVKMVAQEFKKDVGDAGVAVKENGNAALQGLDGGNAVALDGWHEEEMGPIVEFLARRSGTKPWKWTLAAMPS